MNKKVIIAILCVVLCAIIGFGAYLVISDYKERNGGTINPGTKTDDGNNNSDITFNEDDNSQIITTKSNSTIRVINYYDKTMFEGKNTILFMWASWCPNCATEMQALNDIIKKYKNDKDVNIVFIAHEFKYSGIDGLLSLLEGGTVDFDTEILLDFGRVIRKAIDPEASTIPKTYFLDKNSNILHKLDEAVTVEQIDNLINQYYK